MQPHAFNFPSRMDDNIDAILDVKQQTWYGYLPAKLYSHLWVVQSKRISFFFFPHLLSEF